MSLSLSYMLPFCNMFLKKNLKLFFFIIKYLKVFTYILFFFHVMKNILNFLLNINIINHASFFHFDFFLESADSTEK